MALSITPHTHLFHKDLPPYSSNVGQCLTGRVGYPVSVRCRATVASRSTPDAAVVSGDSSRVTVEKLWKEFFADPSQWRDGRAEKVNARYPDFKHKTTQKVLWLDHKLTPPWVEVELAALAPGTVESDIFTWNTRLARYVKAGQFEKTIKLFHQMQQEGILPNAFTFVPVVNACAGLRALKEGRLIHAKVIEFRCETDAYVSSGLVNMYGKCGSIEDAWQVFIKMPTRNEFSWTAMILASVKCGLGHKALSLFRQMKQDGVEPNATTFVAVLNACALVVELEEGRCVHRQIIQSGYESNVFVGNSLVDMYAKCGNLEDALSVFNKLLKRDVVSCTAMIMGYVKCGQGRKALELFQQMQQEGVEPDHITFLGVLNACASAVALEEGRSVHKQIIEKGLESNVFLGNSLIDMYVKCESIKDAQRSFNNMPTRNAASWGCMILGLVKYDQGYQALELYQLMQKEGVNPDPVTFVGVLNACASVGALEEGRGVHAQIIQRGWESDVFICNSLIDMYSKCGSIEEACRVFQQMPRQDVVSWNAMIMGHVKCKQGQRAIGLFRQMQSKGVDSDPVTFVGMLNACASVKAIEEGQRVHEQIIHRGWESNPFLGNSLIDMYAKCGNLDKAWAVFNKMPRHDVVSWNSMILGLVKFGEGQKALDMFQQMQVEGVDPDRVTFVALLNACASVTDLEEGRCVHEQIIQRGWECDVFIGSSLIDMYSKCGNIHDAQIVFKNMPVHDVVSWTAMIAGYGLHGYAKEAVEHFNRMSQEGIEMNEMTFVALLSACSHGGLVDEGLHYFNTMSEIYHISPTVYHYACVVDLLGRAGLLQEAEDLIQGMPCEPDAAVWVSFLGACSIHGNVERGERFAKRVLELDPGNDVGYVLLSNIYASAGKWDRRVAIQQERLQKCGKRHPGQTWIEVCNQVHLFTAQDQKHPRTVEIYKQLDILSEQMEKGGYIPDTRCLLDEVGIEEKEFQVYHHSEKLAIAFGLICTPPHTPLRVWKNFRMCGDCHTAMKFISKLVGRTITVRDANRFHRFENGCCSCNDNW